MRFKEFSNVSEIVKHDLGQGVQNFNADQFTTIIQHTSPILSTNDYKIFESKNGSTLSVVMADMSNDLIGGLKVDTSSNPYPSMEFSYTSNNYRGKGYLSELLRYYTKNHGPLMSDIFKVMMQ